MSALLAFSLGPVQPFIAQARKTRDLWIGSYLLSMLMRAALEEYPGDILFPVLDSTPNKEVSGTSQSPHSAHAVAGVPNKFVALHRNVEEAISAATLAQERIETTWRTLATQVWDKIFTAEQDTALAAIWQRQTDTNKLFEMYWAVVPYDEDSDAAYGFVYQKAQALLVARKRLRNFAAANEFGEKSTISGEREALHRGPVSPVMGLDSAPPPVSSRKHGPRGFLGLFRRHHEPAQPPLAAGDVDGSFGGTGGIPELQSDPADGVDPRAFWRDVAQRFPAAQLSRAGRERLDAIDVVKRFATDAPLIGSPRPFPSTDTLAATPFFTEVIKYLQRTAAPNPLEQAASAWIACAEGAYHAVPAASPALARLATSSIAKKLLRCDGEALYPESFSPRRLQDTSLEREKIADLATRGSTAVHEFVRQALAAGLAPPSSYYAILRLDGDHMGQLLSSMPSLDEHCRLSQALSAFARTRPRQVVEDGAFGRVVYAGGDDVLAFLPVCQALSAARRLRDRYRKALTDVSPQATASAGIAIAHRRMPLRLALRAAREAEHAAKDRYGRDALAVSLLPRSGAITLVGAHWEYTPAASLGAAVAGSDPVREALAVSKRLRSGDLSPRFVYTVLEEAPILARLDGAARRAELARLLLRQRSPDRIAQFSDDAVDTLARELCALAADFDRTLSRELSDGAGYDLGVEGPRRGMVELAGWLVIAAFLARGEDEA